MSPALVTTSWDDGHPLDLRLAELLAGFGLKGTFYVPSRDAKSCRARLLSLRGLGMEIGSHTVSHPVLTKLGEAEARSELRDSRRQLEDVLGEPVPSFCYPTGAFNPRLAAMVSNAGYMLGRTTVAFRTGFDLEPSMMPVSFQFFPHPWHVNLRHAAKEGNGSGIINWLRTANGACDLLRLNRRMLSHVARSGGVLHLWGHSWEIDRYGLWGVLEEALKEIAREGLTACTNSEVLAYSRR